MRILAAALTLLPAAALAQQQEAAVPSARDSQGPVYDMVAADRETAWRINRVTGEVTVCRIDTTGSLDAAVRARCSAATMEGAAAQQSQAPAAQQSQAPLAPGAGRP